MASGMRPVAAAVALAAAVLTAAGCSGTAVNTGPFGGADWNSGRYCVPISHPGELVTDGFYDVRNNWRGTVAVISKISLVRPHGLKLVRAYAVRLHDHALYGTMPGLPPHDDGVPYPWKDHENAIGTRVPYIKSKAIDTNLLLVLSTSGRKSTDQGIIVWYHVGSSDYELRTHFAAELLASPARC